VAARRYAYRPYERLTKEELKTTVNRTDFLWNSGHYRYSDMSVPALVSFLRSSFYPFLEKILKR
jgi:hypothetical protein